MSEKHIGDVEIPAINDIDPQTDKEETEIDALGLEDPVEVEHEPGLEQLTIAATLHEQLHSDSQRVGLQRESIQSLVEKLKGENSFDYLNWTGWLSIESVNAPRDGSQSTLINATINARYLPKGEYQSGVKATTYLTSNEFGLDRPGTFALPTFVHNVKVRNPITGDEVDLSPIATETAEDGNIDIYTLWSAFQPSGFSGTNTLNVKKHYSGLQSADLTSSGDDATYAFTVPDGRYKLKARVQDNNVTDDVTLDVGGNTDTKSTGTTDITTLTSSEYSVDSSVTSAVRKATSNSNTIHVDGFYLEPQFAPEILFDVEVGVDPSTNSDLDYTGKSFNAADRVSPVRVYDDMGSSNESDWERIHSIDHSFEGGAVIDNGIIRYWFNSSTSGFHAEDDGELQYYVRDGGSWTQFGRLESYDGTGTTTGFREVFPKKITPSEVEVEFRIGTEPGELNPLKTVTIKRGWYVATWDWPVDKVLNEFNTGTLNSGAGAIGATNEDVFHHLPGDAFWNNISSSDMWAVEINVDGSSYLPILGANKDNQQLQGMGKGLSINTSIEPFTGYHGAIPFPEASNLHIEAENASYSSGAAVNHWEMPLGTSGNLNEFDGQTSNFTEDTANSKLTHSRDAYDNIYINALEFGATESTGHRMKITASDTTDDEVAFLRFCYDNANQDFYSATINISSGFAQLSKTVGGSSNYLADTSMSLSYGTTYVGDIEFDPSTGTIDFYVWEDGTGRPSTPTVSATDTAFSNGGISYQCYGSVDLNHLEVNAKETTSSSDSAVIVPENVITGSDENCYDLLTAGTDVPLGTYLSVIRWKQTNTAAFDEHGVVNNTDSSTVDVDGNSQYKTLTSSTSYQYSIREVRLNSDDDGDTFRHAYWGRDTSDVGHAVVDEFILVPVSLQAGGSRIGPQDAMHEALMELDTRRVTRER